MKDSQPSQRAVITLSKYVKVDNERFSTAPSLPPSLKYIKVNNERFSTHSFAPRNRLYVK